MNKAREAGVDEATIRKAVEVGRMVRKGAAARFDKETAVTSGTDT
jgi:hypothetical protein